MAYRGQGQKVQKVMVQPIRSRIQVWLYEQVNMRIEGCIIRGDGKSWRVVLREKIKYEPHIVSTADLLIYYACMYTYTCFPEEGTVVSHYRWL
ncbi:small nuclear ribonucleoprotein E-like protein [Cricetulus griseus]|nr:small nuclear ribonucleoprotein E-like protein [Cricetulus griseus]